MSLIFTIKVFLIFLFQYFLFKNNITFTENIGSWVVLTGCFVLHGSVLLKED